MAHESESPRLLIERDGAVDSCAHPYGHVILKIFTDAGPVADGWNIQRAQPLCPANPGMLQQNRRADGTRGQDHLLACTRDEGVGADAELNPGRPLLIEKDPRDARVGDYPKIRAAEGRREKRIRGTTAATAADVELRRRQTRRVRGVVIVAGGQA